jgi:hypothetical protein
VVGGGGGGMGWVAGMWYLVVVILSFIAGVWRAHNMSYGTRGLERHRIERQFGCMAQLEFLSGVPNNSLGHV